MILEKLEVLLLHTIVTSAIEGGQRLCFHPCRLPVCLRAGYLKMLWTDLDKT